MPTSTTLERPSPQLEQHVFITGASGFIGRAMAERFRVLGAKVTGMDRRTRSR